MMPVIRQTMIWMYLGINKFTIDMTTGKAMLGVLAGIAAGAIMGALFTAKAKSNKSISKKGADLAEALNEKIDAKFEEMIASMADKVNKPGKTAELAGKARAEGRWM